MALVWPGCGVCIHAAAAKYEIIKAQYAGAAALPDKPGNLIKRFKTAPKEPMQAKAAGTAH